MSQNYDVQLLTIVNGATVPQVGVWVQLVNNDTGTAYVSTGITNGLGKATFSPKPPGDTYVVNISAISSSGAWSAFGISNWAVPVVQGDDPAFHSVSTMVGSPYANTLPGDSSITTPAGVAAGAVYDYGGMTFNVKAFGATMSASDDGRSAFEKAIAAAVAFLNSAVTLGGADVVIPPGTLKLSSTAASPPTNPSTGLAYANTIGCGLPVGLTRTLRIRGMGRGVSFIKLTANAQNALWINQTADYDTFKNVTIEDLTVDNDSTTGRCHVLIGSMPAANTSQRRLNYENLNVRRVDILNVPVDATQATTAKNGVLFLGDHVSALEATQTHSTEITVEDLRQYGGDGAVQVTSYHAGSFTGGTNHYYDQIKVRRIVHDNSAAGVPAATIAQTSVYICGTGFGDYFEAVDIKSTNIGDDVLEVGAMQTGLIDGIVGINPYLLTVLFRNSHALQDVSAQQIRIGSIITRITSAGAAVSGLVGRPVNWIGDDSLTFGEFDIACCDWWGDSLLYSKQAQANICITLTASVAKIVFDKLKIRLSNFGQDSGAGTIEATLFNQAAAAGMVVIRDLDVVAAVAASAGAGLTYNFTVVKHVGTNNSLTIDGFTVDLTGSAWTASTGGRSDLYQIGKTGGTGLLGSIRRMYPSGSLPTGIGPRIISINSAGTIKSLMVEESDFTGWSGISAGRDIEATSAGVNAAKTYVRDVIDHGGVRIGPTGRRSTAADYTILAIDSAVIGVTSTASARTITLPALSQMVVGQIIYVMDESNAAGTNNITVSRVGSDVFTDAATTKVINTNSGALRFYASGGKWCLV